jgi:type I site-specific restriction endonuclease
VALSEADTCRKFVVPKLQAAGWDDEPHSITEQRCTAAKLDALLPAIFDRAFRGEL